MPIAAKHQGISNAEFIGWVSPPRAVEFDLFHGAEKTMDTNTQLDCNRLPVTFPPGFRLHTLTGGGAVGHFLKVELGSGFQPLMASNANGASGAQSPAAYEAFVRTHAEGELSLSPWNLFASAADDLSLITLDRLCRIVHVYNFRRFVRDDDLLFLNIHGRLLAAVGEDHGRVFRGVLEQLALAPGRIVLETPATANTERTLLAFAFANYRLNGFKVAANTTGLADLEELVRGVRPDFVKVDARHLPQPAQMQRAIRIAADSGIRLVFTRVERREQRDFLRLQPGVLMQGWAVGGTQVPVSERRSA
jgi:EAL domain-containing protein (putative c-di-GMP-specific phosphodiesterase class I)